MHATAALLNMLSSSRQAPPGSKATSSTTAAGPGSSSTIGTTSSSNRPLMRGDDLAHLQQLAGFFNGLVDELSANVQQLALKGFNQWLVSGSCSTSRGSRGSGWACVRAMCIVIIMVVVPEMCSAGVVDLPPCPRLGMVPPLVMGLPAVSSCSRCVVVLTYSCMLARLLPRCATFADLSPSIVTQRTAPAESSSVAPWHPQQCCCCSPALC